MINAPRVLFVARRFWPMANDEIWRLLDVGELLTNDGFHVEYLSAQWHSAWPQEIILRDFKVHRLGPSPTNPLRSRRFTRSVCEWINQSGREFDFIVINADEEEALSLTTLFGSNGPQVIVRFDATNCQLSRWDRRRAQSQLVAQQASAAIVSDDHVLRQLVSNNIAADRLIKIADTSTSQYPRCEASRAAARRALASINYELFLRGDDFLMLCMTDMHKSSNLEFLLRSIGPVAEARRNMRLWLIGDGPERLKLYELIRREGWRGDMIMPGTFEDPELLMSAADLCLLPGMGQGLGWILPTALKIGLPVIACDGPNVREVLHVHHCPILYESGDSLALRRKVEEASVNPTKLQQQTASLAMGLPTESDVLEQWRSLASRLQRVRS